MKKLILLLFAAAFYCTTATAQQERFIEVVAEEKMEVTPNEYTFSFRLREKTRYVEDNAATGAAEEELAVPEEDIAEAIEEGAAEEVEVAIESERNTKKRKPKKRIVISVAQQEKEIRDYLKTKGIKDEYLTPASNNRDYYNESRKEYLIRIDKPELLREIIKKLEMLGASRVRVQSFRNTMESQHKNEMSVKALASAKKQAEKLVAVYGEKLGKVISISEVFNNDTNGEMTKFYELIMSELMRKNRTQTFNTVITYRVKVKFVIK